MRFLSCGERAVLAEVDDVVQVMALHQRLTSERPAGVLDVIPAARTVMVVFDPISVTAQRISDWMTQAVDAPASIEAIRTVEIPVHYDGQDLAEVSALLGRTPAELVALHTGTEFTVAFCGFAPGFGYLTGLPAGLRVPRRSAPRTRVPAGSVGLADQFTGIYPRESPGGWQLIGRTDATVFDLDRNPPALLTPGTLVRFVPVKP